jgi:anti-anti-sigma factor
MKLDYARVGDIAILEFRGELDAFNLSAVTTAIDKVIERGEVKLVFNVRRLTFINSSGLGYLLKARRKAQAAGGDVAVVEPGKFMRKVIVTMNLHKVLALFDSEEKAFDFFDADMDASGHGTTELADDEKDESIAGANAIFFTVHTSGRDRKFVGRITSLYTNGLKFRWDVPNWKKAKRRPPLSNANFDKEVQPGMKLPIKFRQPFMVKDHYFEMDSRVARVTRDTLDDGSDEAYFAVEYINPSPQDQKLLERFVSDMEMFREELEAIESAGQDD